MSGRRRRLEGPLLAACVAAATVAAVCAIGWYRARTAPRPLDTLTAQERSRLTRELLAASPGIYEPTPFNPAVGFTLKHEMTLDAWGGTFRTNDLGYRTRPSAKRPGTFRIVFVGDSWAFGQGVSAEEAFPHVVEALARRFSGLGDRVEAWTLALPGYNTFNQVAALESFYDRLRPDAVVWCPTINDVDSSLHLLPNGSLGYIGFDGDAFPQAMGCRYYSEAIDSYVFLSRWELCFQAIRRSELRLKRRGVPLLVFFTAPWDEPLAHHLVAQSQLEAPYIFTPPALLGLRYLNRLMHPNAEAHRLYAHLVYDTLAGLLGWRQAEPSAGMKPVEPPWRAGPGLGGRVACEEALRTRTRDVVPTSFTPSAEALRQSISLVDHRTGLLARHGYVIVRRRTGARLLRVRLQRLPGADFLYPMRVTIEVPSPAGGTRVALDVPRDGDPTVTVRVALPADIPEGAAIDVLVEADGVAYGPGWELGGSLELVSVEQAES